MKCLYFVAVLLLATASMAQDRDGPVDSDFEVAVLEEADVENAPPSAAPCQPAETEIDSLTFTEAASSLVAFDTETGEEILDEEESHDAEAHGSDIAIDELEALELDDNGAGDVPFNMMATLMASLMTGLATLAVL